MGYWRLVDLSAFCVLFIYSPNARPICEFNIYITNLHDDFMTVRRYPGRSLMPHTVDTARLD